LVGFPPLSQLHHCCDDVFGFPQLLG
jgi:hypothetical protein